MKNLHILTKWILIYSQVRLTLWQICGILIRLNRHFPTSSSKYCINLRVFPYSLNDHTIKRDSYWPVWAWSMIECQTMTKRFRLSSIVLNYSHPKILSITIDLKMANEKFTTFNYFWPLNKWPTDPPLTQCFRVFEDEKRVRIHFYASRGKVLRIHLDLKNAD